MKQLTIYDFLDDPDYFININETPTTNDQLLPEFEDHEPSMTPIETLITNCINRHIKHGSFPSLDEAKAIEILDMINGRYNDVSY